MKQARMGLCLLAACAVLCAGPYFPASPSETFPVLQGPYLGQRPPGLKAELFAPGIINTGMFTRDVAMTPDGTELYFGLATGNYGWSTICVTRLRHGRWTEPEVMAHMEDPNVLNFEPCISPDGKRFFFLSTRADSASGEKAGDQDIWVMDRRGEDWGEPANLGGPVNTEGAEYFPSVTRDGTMYFTRAESDGRTSFIYRSRLREGRYQEPEKLPPQVNCGPSQFNAFIAPDESYIIVPVAGRRDSLGGTDYYIVYRDEDDTWSEPVNMGPEVNTAGGQEFSPYISTDGKFFFFMSSRFLPRDQWPDRLTYARMREVQGRAPNGSSAVYWMDAALIQSLRPKMERTTLAVCVWEASQFNEALALAESFRSFGGRMAHSPFVVYILTGLGGPDGSSTRKFKELDVEFKTFSAGKEARAFPFASKIYAAAQAEAELQGKSDILVWMDPDTVIWREPRAFILEKGRSLGYRPVMHQLIGSSYDQPPDAFWARLYELLGVRHESLFPMTTPVDRARIRPYVNAGLLVVRPERGLLRAWREAYLKTAFDAVLLEHCRLDPRKSVFLHQAVLAGALLVSLPREEMTELPEEYNYPLNLHDQIPASRRPVSLDGFTSIRYDEGGRVPELLRTSGLSGKKVDWLLAHFPAPGR